MHSEIEEIKKIFEHVSIDTFIKYFYTFQKNSNERSNNSIYEEFDKNKEIWGDKSRTSRASKGKSIFRKSLEIPALIYITEYANDNKISPEIIKEANNIFSQITKYDTLLDNDNNNVLDLFKNEKKALISIRSSQNSYKKRLINYWEGSSILNCTDFNLLIASHIKKYSECENSEKYDLYNGLLLTPNYDKLFDNYLITFDSDGRIIISESLSKETLDKLGIDFNASIRTEKLKQEHLKYLAIHRDKFNSK